MGFDTWEKIVGLVIFIGGLIWGGVKGFAKLVSTLTSKKVSLETRLTRIEERLTEMEHAQEENIKESKNYRMGLSSDTNKRITDISIEMKHAADGMQSAVKELTTTISDLGKDLSKMGEKVAKIEGYLAGKFREDI